MKDAVVLLFLAVNAWRDIKKRQIFLLFTGVFGAAGIVYSLVQGRAFWEVAAAAGPGAFFLAMSIWTRGAVGLGDCWLLMALGMVLGPESLLGVICAGLLLAAGWSVVLLVLWKKGRKTELPFVFFLLLGYVGGLCIW